MFLRAHLGWIDGYPVAQGTDHIIWRPRPRITAEQTEAVTIDREVIRQAQFTLNKLSHRFPRAMPKLVGDVEAWAERVRDLLERLKSGIHASSDLLAADSVPRHTIDSNLDRRIRVAEQNQPRLSSVFEAVIWSGLVRTEPRDALLEWISDYAAQLDRHLEVVGIDDGLPNILILADLARHDGPQSALPLIELISDPVCFEVPATDFLLYARQLANFFRRWVDRENVPARPTPTQTSPGSAAIELLQWIARQPSAVRTRAIRFTSLLLSKESLQQTHRAWVQLESDFRREFGLVRQLSFGKSQKAFREAARDAAQAIDQHVAAIKSIVPLRPQITQQLVQQISTAGSSTLCRVLSETLELLPADSEYAARLTITADTARGLERQSAPKPRVRYLQLYSKLLITYRDQPWLTRLWKRAISGWRDSGHVPPWSSPAFRLQTELPDQRLWPRFFEALAILNASGADTTDFEAELAWLIKLTRSVGLSLRYYRDLVQLDLMDSIFFEELEALLEIADGPHDFPMLCKALVNSSSLDEQSVTCVRSLHAQFRTAGWPEAVPYWLTSDGVSRFQKLLPLLSILEGSRSVLTVPQRHQDASLPDWGRRYPAELHPLIAEIASVSDRGQQCVEQILRRDFPDPQAIRRELQALKQKLVEQPGRSHLQARINSLTQRLENPRQVSGQRLERLNDKLRHALYRNLWTQLTTRATELLGQVQGRMGFGSVPINELLTGPHSELLAGVMKLDEPQRIWGLQVLRAGSGELDWDPDREPANIRFVERLREIGIDPAPWLYPQIARVVPHPKTQKNVAIDFARDRRDILLMGYHFNTCLSPQAFNFFSAVTNAVDINKRVLYARDMRGSVVGRCLLAIGDRGSIVAFNPYCHDSEFPFSQHVKMICSELARSMKTVVSDNDPVSALVGDGWYDDGAYDPGIAISSSSSPLATAIETATEENLVAQVSAALKPLQINERTIPFIVAHPALAQKPQLIKPLIPIIEDAGRLPDETQLRAAALAHQAGQSRFARTRILRLAPGFLMAGFRRESEFAFENQALIVDALLEVNPTQILRILRRTRPPGVSDDGQEDYVVRLRLLAEAHERLGRAALASRLRAKLGKPERG